MNDSKPHAVLIPYPVQGHINPLLKLAKLLHLRGFHITFVNTEYKHKRLLKSRGPNAFDGLTDFTFEAIPDGLTPADGDGDVSQDIRALCKSIRKNFLQPFRELLARLHESFTAGLIPPVTCLVYDWNMSFTIQVAEELSLHVVLFSPSNACTFLTLIQLRTLLDKGLIPLKVLIPYPVQGHINPLIKLAKILHLRGFHITFVNTEYNHKRLLKSRGPNAFDGLADFTFETIPDGLASIDGDDDGDVSQDIYALCESIRTNFLQPFRELLARLNDSATSGLFPPVSCIIADNSMSFTIQAAEELSIPVVFFSPANACTFWTGFHLLTMFDKGVIPLKDESYLTNGYLDTKVDCIPGLQNFRLKDLPGYIRITDPNDCIVQFTIEAAGRAHKAFAFIFNTSNELEKDVMNVLSSTFPNICAIGPLSSLLSQSPQNHLGSLSTNLWKEDTKCLDWLESKEPRSVVYVNFGSMTVMTAEKLLEFAWGLANSKQPFLWIIRPDLVIGDSVVLSSEFVNEISDRGLIASWCPQEQVLNHPSIGGFLTHCGWNSTTESICAGVPMLCWPFFADQPANCRYICNEWEIGMEIDTNVKRDEVEKLVNELMVGEKGKKMRQKAIELKKQAEEDTRPGGCSYTNLDKVINEVLLKQNQT